jgi:hypothetical protein
MSEAGAGAPPAVPTATGPFKALIAGWSLAVAVLSVAGFSLRWNYYYNFGLHSLVLEAPLARLPVYAIEILRSRESIIDLLRLAVIWLLPFHLVLLAITQARLSSYMGLRAAAALGARVLGLDNPLLVDAVTAGIIIAIAFEAGGNAGYRDYKINVAQATSKLPRVTAVALTDEASARWPMACDTRPLKDRGPPSTLGFIGSPQTRDFMTAGAGCSSEARSWRLLLRDERFIYLFATVSDGQRRPETLVLPANENVALVLE